MGNHSAPQVTLRIGILAGEASGDNLGAGLMRAIQAQLNQTSSTSDATHSPAPNIEFVGIGGPMMLAAGLQPMADMQALNVNGFREPIVRLPSLLKLLWNLERSLKELKIDAFVGVDFNVFNFILEGRLKKAGIPTVHYVSPSVYAWRTGRTKRVAKSADLLLCLYPFEPHFYRHTNVQAVFVGHPLADEISAEDSGAASVQAAREELGLALHDPVLAVLPGSRSSEVKLMIEPFLVAARLLAQDLPGLQVVIPCPRPALKEMVEAKIAELDLACELKIVCNADHARRALVACDFALVKSGTSTLETMLLHRPMVVSYRLGALSYQLAKRLLRTEFVALPNILTNSALVPELLQDDGSAEQLAAALKDIWLEAADRDKLVATFVDLHAQLKQDANRQAATAVLGLLNAN